MVGYPKMAKARRARLIGQAKQMRDSGMTLPEIQAELNLPYVYVREFFDIMDKADENRKKQG